MLQPGNSPVTRERIVADLRELGLMPGDRLLLHSSLSSLGFVEGGPERVIAALLDVLGPAGALIMPSFQKGSEHVLVRQGVRFDVRTSPSELHTIENTGGAPTVCRECFQPVVVDAAGRELVVPTFPHLPGLKRRYERVERLLLDAGAQRNGPVGQATARLIEAARMDDLVRAELRHDPLYLIEVYTP